MKGQESGWTELAQLRLPTGKLMIGDYSFIPHERDCLVLDVPAGEYVVSAKIMTYGDDQRVSRTRLQLVGTGDVSAAQVLGTTWTDTANTGFCDYERYKEAFDRLDVTANWDRYMGPAEQEAGGGIVELDRDNGAVMVFVPSGFGDGEFEVLALVRDGQLVGAEVEFIKPDEPYPF